MYKVFRREMKIASSYPESTVLCMNKLREFLPKIEEIIVVDSFVS